MYKKFTYVIFFWTFLLTQFNCTGNNKINQVALPAEKATVIIPFMPGDCHQCNDVFYKNLEVLDSQHGGILFLIPDNYSDDLDYIKKANKLESYKNDQFFHLPYLTSIEFMNSLLYFNLDRIPII
jgi:hypothetical protein